MEKFLNALKRALAAFIEGAALAGMAEAGEVPVLPKGVE